MPKRRQPKRRNHERRTTETFRKTYGQNVYHFKYEKAELDGYVSVMVTVWRKHKGDSKLRVGELVHQFLWQRMGDEEYST